MEKLDITHHKIILLCIILIVLITGMIFGVQLSSATRGTDGLLIIVFALSFLSMVMLFVIFMQIIHMRDEMMRAHALKAQPTALTFSATQKKITRHNKR